MGETIQVTVTGYSKKGYGVSKLSEKKRCYVFGGVKGDVCDVDIIKKKRRDSFGVVTHLVEPSKDRVEPLCVHFTKCGGCSLQTTSYEKQLEHKMNQIQELASPLSLHIEPILACQRTTKYRSNKPC